MMQRLMIMLAMIVIQPSPTNGYAQELHRVVDRFGGTATATVVGRHSVEIPDSVRQKVGYHHWKGAAIGGGLGAVAGLVLGLAARVSCSDCDPSIAATSLTVAGLGGAFGFLVGLASPKYEWVPSPGVKDSSGSRGFMYKER
jgi:hypothetical protein